MTRLDRQIRYLAKPNGGVASALNYGIREMTGEYFSWLSHDDKYFPDKIASQIELLSTLEDPNTIIFCGFALIDENNREILRTNPYDKYTHEQLRIPLFTLLRGQVGGCCLLIHRSHFQRVGIFDESLLATQDFDLWFRIMRGAHVDCHKRVLSMTRIHKRQGSKTRNSEFIEEGNALWIKIMDSLTTQEIVEIDSSIYLFYKNMYSQLTAYTLYRDAAQHAKARALEELHKEYRSGIHPVFSIKAIALLCSGYTCLAKSFVLTLIRNTPTDTWKRMLYVMRRLSRR